MNSGNVLKMDSVDSNEQTEREFWLDIEPSNWTCYLFGSYEGAGIKWIPDKGCVPNVFVRFFMKVCLGCTWVKQEKEH